MQSSAKDNLYFVDTNSSDLRVVESDKSSFAELLLSFEADVRDIADPLELKAHFCNNAQSILGFRQGFFLQKVENRNDYHVEMVTSLAVIDRDVPMIRWIEKIVSRALADQAPDKQHIFSLPAYCDDTDEEMESYPFSEFLWTPLLDDQQVVGGILTTREKSWKEDDIALAKRLAKLYAYGLRAIKGRGRLGKKRLINKKRSIIAIGVLILVGLIPIPMTALAPVTVTPLEPYIVSAPFDGVVREIVIDQGAKIEENDLLIQFDDVSQHNEAEIADRRATVSETKLLRISQSAIYSDELKKELAIAQAEYNLALSEREYANDILEKTRFISPVSGIAVYTDKRDWVGRPIRAGQTILQIAKPDQVHFTIDLPVKESIVLKEGAAIKVFLDSAPLNPINATLTQASFQARLDDQNILSYRLFATINADNQNTLPRIGVKGTAQVQGDKVPLFYAIFRRPLSSLRQITGF